MSGPNDQSVLPTSDAKRAEQGSPVRRRLDSTVLFGTAREVIIDHHGEEYRLRLTSQGKLILTK
jgi:hemin uptake protein HemP